MATLVGRPLGDDLREVGVEQHEQEDAHRGRHEGHDLVGRERRQEDQGEPGGPHRSAP